MVNLCKIDGVSYDVLVTAIEESAVIEEGANSGISLYRRREIRDLVGIKIGHTVTFAPGDDVEAFDRLFDYLFSALRESVVLEAVHNQTSISYEAAYNTGKRRVSHIDDDTDTVYWDELTVEFRPIENQVNPE